MLSNIFLKEVEFIDGNVEFLLSSVKTQLLDQNSNLFILSETPAENTIVFSGDTSLFKKQVYKEVDLDVEGSYFIKKEGSQIELKIHPDKNTSSITYTYITYTSKNLNKTAGLFSVDYEKGIMYTSSNVKNLEISYKHSTSYYKGLEMTQANSTEYTNLNNLSTNDNETVVYVYQLEEETVPVESLQSIENPKLHLITLEDNDEY